MTESPTWAEVRFRSAKAVSWELRATVAVPVNTPAVVVTAPIVKLPEDPAATPARLPLAEKPVLMAETWPSRTSSRAPVAALAMLSARDTVSPTWTMPKFSVEAMTGTAGAKTSPVTVTVWADRAVSARPLVPAPVEVRPTLRLSEKAPAVEVARSTPTFADPPEATVPEALEATDSGPEAPATE